MKLSKLGSRPGTNPPLDIGKSSNPSDQVGPRAARELDTTEQVRAVMEVAEVIQNIPAKVETLFSQATEEGSNSYVSSNSWSDMKQKPKEEERK